MSIMVKKSNAQRSAERATTRTGKPHKVEAVDGGYRVVAVETGTTTPAAKSASGKRFFKATDGHITVFRATETTYRSAAFTSGYLAAADAGRWVLTSGDIRFSKAAPRVGLFPVEAITEAEYQQLVARKNSRIQAEGGVKTYSITPRDSWISNAASAPVAPISAQPLRSHAEPARHAGKKAAALEAAKSGQLPTPPDFSADTHKPYRAKLAKLVALAEAGDTAGLAAIAINPTSTSPKALIRYRDLAVTAIRARNGEAV